jgi:hypothetical protein
MADQYSNFVTPPDFVEDPHTSVLIIDADWADIEDIALWCKTAPKSYNIYIYSDIMMDEIWLAHAINSVNIVVLNTEDSAVKDIKTQLLQAGNVWYYGEHTFRGNKQKLGKPIEWFINDNK